MLPGQVVERSIDGLASTPTYRLLSVRVLPSSAALLSPLWLAMRPETGGEAPANGWVYRTPHLQPFALLGKRPAGVVIPIWVSRRRKNFFKFDLLSKPIGPAQSYACEGLASSQPAR